MDVITAIVLALVALVVVGAAIYILGFILSMFAGAFVSVEESIRHPHHHGPAAV